jgi:hypothetical protein
MDECQDVDDLPLIVNGVDDTLALHDALSDPFFVGLGQSLADAW